MGAISKADIGKIAKLAAIEISDQEADALAGELSAIVGYVEALDRVSVEGVEAMSHVHGATNVMRNDDVAPSMRVEELLAIVPHHAGRFIKTPLVVESE